MNPGHLVDVQVARVAGVALHQPAEALEQADDPRATALGQDRGRSDHAVDAGSGPTPDQNAERRHACSLSSAGPEGGSCAGPARVPISNGRPIRAAA